MNQVYKYISFNILGVSLPIWAETYFIRSGAHALSGRRFDADFVEWFLPLYFRGGGKNNLNDIAKFLFSVEYIGTNRKSPTWKSQTLGV